MTYKLEPGIIERIESPIKLLLPGTEPLVFRESSVLLDTEFDRKYSITSIKAEEGTVVIELCESDTPDVPFD